MTTQEKIPVYVDILLQQSRNPFTADTVKYIFSTVHRYDTLDGGTLDGFVYHATILIDETVSYWCTLGSRVWSVRW